MEKECAVKDSVSAIMPDGECASEELQKPFGEGLKNRAARERELF
jgi:hypothetical protein